ncbi:hypothetical protein V2O64_06755 [Verrucomicrobiaceae bacterium 227]
MGEEEGNADTSSDFQAKTAGDHEVGSTPADAGIGGDGGKGERGQQGDGIGDDEND